jgi:hypothetical protein
MRVMTIEPETSAPEVRNTTRFFELRRVILRLSRPIGSVPASAESVATAVNL